MSNFSLIDVYAHALTDWDFIGCAFIFLLVFLNSWKVVTERAWIASVINRHTPAGIGQNEIAWAGIVSWITNFVLFVWMSAEKFQEWWNIEWHNHIRAIM